MKTRIFSAVLSAFMLASASAGVTAYAEETAVSTTENKTEISTETTVISAETIPDFYGDPYYDTNGNASLIKSEQIIYNTEEMQFIAVTTKDGHVFYVLINYTADNGEDNVFFLNKVDDYDLYALLYAGDENKESNITPEQAAQAAENANGRVTDNNSPVAETSETPTNSEDNSEPAEQPKQNNMNSIYLLLGAVALIGVGGAGFFMMKKKKGNKMTAASEPEYDEEAEIIEEDDDFPDYAFHDDNGDDE